MVKQTQNKSTSIIIKNPNNKKVIFTPKEIFHCKNDFISILANIKEYKDKHLQNTTNQKLPQKKMLPSKVMTPKSIKCKNGKRKETEIHVKYSIIMLIMYSKERTKERKSLVVGLNFTFILICFYNF